jgi:hypothetical protein
MMDVKRRTAIGIESAELIPPTIHSSADFDVEAERRTTHVRSKLNPLIPHVRRIDDLAFVSDVDH